MSRAAHAGGLGDTQQECAHAVAPRVKEKSGGLVVVGQGGVAGGEGHFLFISYFIFIRG